VNKRMPISIAIERIEEVRDSNDDPDIIESSVAALTTLNLLFTLGFNEVSLLEEEDNG